MYGQLSHSHLLSGPLYNLWWELKFDTCTLHDLWQSNWSNFLILLSKCLTLICNYLLSSILVFSFSFSLFTIHRAIEGPIGHQLNLMVMSPLTSCSFFTVSCTPCSLCSDRLQPSTPLKLMFPDLNRIPTFHIPTLPPFVIPNWALAACFMIFLSLTSSPSCIVWSQTPSN